MMSTALQKQPTMAQYLNRDGVKKYLDSVLNERSGQLITSLVSMSKLVPKMSAVQPETLLNCGLKAASMNLPLDNNLGFAYAVPYGDSATFQIGYKGLVQLAQRTGQYKLINVVDVRVGELEKWDMFTEELRLVPIEDAEKREKQPVVGYAAMFELLNGYSKKVYWTRARVEAHGKRFSKAFTSGPWKSDFDAMAKKTVLKDLLSKWGPLSTEMQQALKFDQAVIRKDADGEEIPEYVDADFRIVEDKPSDNLADEFEQMSMDGEGK
jgi:recombination protein RecT